MTDLEAIRAHTWAKHARVIKEPHRVIGRKLEPGLYFVKEGITILGTGETEEAAIKDALKALVKDGSFDDFLREQVKKFNHKMEPGDKYIWGSL